MIKNNEIDLIINTTEGARSIKDSFSIRQEAQNNNISLTKTISNIDDTFNNLQRKFNIR